MGDATPDYDAALEYALSISGHYAGHPSPPTKNARNVAAASCALVAEIAQVTLCTSVGTEGST